MAKARSGTLGIVELVAAADDAPLRQTLKQDERLVRDSATKMQTSLSQTTVRTTAAVGGMSTAAISGTQAFSLLGAQMSAVGGIAGQAIGPLASFGGALAGIGKAAFGAWGALLLVTSALTFVIGKLIEKRRAAKEAREEFEGFVKSISDQQLTLEQKSAGLRLRAEKIRAELAGDPVALRRVLGATRRQSLENELARVVHQELELIEKVRTAPDLQPGGAQFRTFQDRMRELKDQQAEIRRLVVLEHRKTEQDIAKIEDEARQKELEATKKHAEEMAAARQRAAEKLAATPFGRIGVALRDVIRETLQQRQLEAAFQQLDAIVPAILDPLMRKVRAKLGLPALEKTAAEQPGPSPSGRPRIFGVRATGFPDLAALSGTSGQAASELVQLARDRTKKMTQVQRLLARIERRGTGLNDG